MSDEKPLKPPPTPKPGKGDRKTATVDVSKFKTIHKPSGGKLKK